MQKNEDLSAKLQELLHFKKSKKFYAERLNISEEEVGELLKELKKEPVLHNKVTNTEFNHRTGDKTITLISNKPLSPKEIEILTGVDNITTFVDRSWLKSQKDGKWTYSILVISKIKDFYSSSELDNKLKEIFKDTPLTSIREWEREARHRKIIFQEKKEGTALFIYIADDHCGSILKNSLFDNKYNPHLYTNRLLSLLEEIKNLNQNFNELFIIRMGDELDGYNGKTTRYDHDLDSLSNKDQFDIYTTANKIFYEQLFNSKISEHYTIINLLNSNHSGNGFSYIANRALEFWIDVKFPDSTTIIHQDKFIDTYEFGNHVINLTHGKDEKYMKTPLPINLDTKTDLWLMEYNKKHILNGSFISTIKADMHKFNINIGKSGRYVNVPSISSGSNWIEHNYGDSESGCLIEIYKSNSKTIQSIPIWF